jgi:hypothetical protein
MANEIMRPSTLLFSVNLLFNSRSTDTELYVYPQKKKTTGLSHCPFYGTERWHCSLPEIHKNKILHPFIDFLTLAGDKYFKTEGVQFNSQINRKK